MLNFFRRRATMVRILFGFFLVLVCVSMVITLIPGLTGVTTDPTAIEVVAEVGRDRITSWDLQQGVLQMSRTNRVPSDMMWLYTQQVLDSMVVEKATLQEARRLGFQVSEAEMLMRLKQVPDLFPGGKFVGQPQYENMVLDRFGLSVGEFERRFRDSLLTEKLRQVVTDAVAVTPDEIRDAFLQNNEKMVLKYVFVDPAALKKDLAATEAALADYFEKTKDQYQIPEKRSVRILLLENQKVRQGLTIAEAERRKYYQDHIDSYRQQERVSASHILLRVAGKEPAQLDAAKKKAEEILKQLKGGADFAEIAKKNSEDTATAVKGGELGWIGRGQTVPEFEKAAFSLAPGTLSDPVQTEYGIHLLKVQAHEQARLKPLEEVQPEIDSILLDEKVQATLTRTGEQAAADWRRAPENPESLAARYQGTVLSPFALSRGEAVPGLTGGSALSEDIFLLQKDEIGRPVALPTGYAIPQLLDISPARPAEFAEVKEQVRTDYLDAEARAKALARGQELLQMLEKQDKKDLARAARTLGMTAKTSEPVTRAGSIASLGSVEALGPRLRTLQPGEVAGPVPIAGGQVVFQLDSRQPPKEEDLTNQKEAIGTRLLEAKRSLAFSVFQENLKKQLEASGDLRINNAVLERLAVATPPIQ